MRTPSEEALPALIAGAAAVDITPERSVFLYGYPHVPRWSTGVSDPLECSALYLEDSQGGKALFLACDLIFISKRLAGAVRERIRAAMGVPLEAILVSATHTHSGPVTVNYLSNAADPVVPRADQAYLDVLAGRIVDAGCRAVKGAVPAEIGFSIARAEGIGTNRHDPAGPADPDVPLIFVRGSGDQKPIGCMVLYAMHPTVLHDDSTMISGDFPAFARSALRRLALSESCPVVYLNGASGNQSPRHVTRDNTLAEAQRLGERLGSILAEAIKGIRFAAETRISGRRALIDLSRRSFPSVETATLDVTNAKARFEQLRRDGAARQVVRIGECDVFGAEETLELARAAADGRLEAAVMSCLPAEIQVLRVGPWAFAAWPGEFFVEYALALRARVPGTFVVTLANGDLQGYIVTAEAAARGVYEANNAMFAFENGNHFLEATLGLLTTLP